MYICKLKDDKFFVQGNTPYTLHRKGWIRRLKYTPKGRHGENEIDFVSRGIRNYTLRGGIKG